MVIPAFIMFSVFFVVPLTGGIFISFTDWNIMFGNTIRFNGFTNYINTFKDPFFITASINTLVFTAAVVVLRNFFAFVLAL
ncbi:MAG: sugar ABC transporter permease, partial [Treponema sp.]|nr:sugar ABC transporter permease [Treponema sp.]